MTSILRCGDRSDTAINLPVFSAICVCIQSYDNFERTSFFIKCQFARDTFLTLQYECQATRDRDHQSLLEGLQYFVPVKGSNDYSKPTRRLNMDQD